MKPGTVTVGYIHPGHYSACFAESLIDLMFADASGPARIVSHDHGKLAKECGSGGIVDGRNQLAKVMVDESVAEWLFMVDADMGFGSDTLERLLAVADPVGRPVVGALCFAHKTDGRSDHYGVRYRACPTVYDFAELDDKVGFVPRLDYERDAVVACSATGGACVLIHRTVLEQVRDKYGPVWFDPITHPKGPTKFSEDLSFFVRVAGAGFPVHVHTGVTTTHDKGGVFLDQAFYDGQRDRVLV